MRRHHRPLPALPRFGLLPPPLLGLGLLLLSLVKECQCPAGHYRAQGPADC
jgi:hypothetical protein